MSTKKVAIWSLFSCLCFVIGCGDGKKLLPVTGVVKVDGNPAEGAVVMFFPAAPDAPISTANCGPDGKFSVITDMAPGIPAGTYQVTIRWPDPKVKPTEAQKMTGMFNDPPDLLKGKYENKAKSGLKAEITGSTNELPPFELTTK